MSVQIRDIVIYSHDGRRRELALRPGNVSIVTGASKSGKSALIDVVDYCFGSGECHVPEGPIRRSVAWFGLRLQLETGQAFIARRCPSSRASASEECFVDIGDAVVIPSGDQLRQTTNTKGLVALLNGWCGIRDNVHEPPPGQTRAVLSATVRHSLAMCFQTQNELTRKEQLFHISDPDPRKQGHKFQALQDTFPYFLGAVDDDYVHKREEFRRLKEELRSCERRLAEFHALRGDGASKAASLLAQARDAGLTTADPSSWEETVAALRVVGATPMTSIEQGLPEGAEFDLLSTERARLRDVQRRLEDEISAVRAYAQDERGFAREATEQQARLQTIGIFDGVEPGHACPMCAQPLATPVQPPSAEDIKSSLATLSTRLASVTQAAPQIQKALADLEAKLQRVQGALTKNRAAMEAVRTASDRLAEVQDEAIRRAHILGRIALYLESLPELPDTKALEEKAAGLRSRCAALEAELNDDRIQERIDSITSILGQQLTEWARFLELEHSKYPLRLDAKKLTVVADTADGPVPMQRMGSGENWVGYHLIAHLALHRWFAERKRPVPRFLFLDQPSQVYFPAEKDVDGSMALVSEDDRLAVSRMLKLIFEVVAAASTGGLPGMQVIITEHADVNEPWFQEAVAERWRQGKKLVPGDWPHQGEGT
jgi:hypothetical protein